MKYLIKFEELDKTYYGAMKNMADNELEFTPPFESDSEDEVVDRYSKQYPEFSEFFNEFLEIFPTKDVFDDDILKYCDHEFSNDEDAYEDEDKDKEFTNEEIIEKYWSPELEVQVLNNSLKNDFPGGEIWSDFYNSLIDSDWNIN